MYVNKVWSTMKMPKNPEKWIVWLFPVLCLFWCVFFARVNGPFYLSRIDPEYIYLMNGLNCAGLHFDRIGHFDHPGTPFQLLAGLFMRLGYVITGHGGIESDVFSHPEFYLSFSHFLLSLFMAWALLHLGKSAMKVTGKIPDTLILQSGILLSIYFLDFSSRFMPDVLLEIIIIFFSSFCLRFLYNSDGNDRSFILISGILMGIGFVSKINFFPMLLFPLILIPGIKNRILYLVSLLATVFLMFVPILNRLPIVWSIISNKATHSGLYGTGTAQWIDSSRFGHNLAMIFADNLAFSILLVLSVILLIYLLSTRRKQPVSSKILLFFLAYLITMILALVMVAKHYRDHYMMPFTSFNLLVFFVLYHFSRKRWKGRIVPALFVGLFVGLIFFPNLKILGKAWSLRSENRSGNPMDMFIKNTVTPNDYFFVEPTWDSGPLIANGIIYGISYVNHKHVVYNELKSCYPNIFTWEGPNVPYRFLRIEDVDPELLFKSGRNIYLLSSPSRNAGLMVSDLDSKATSYQFSIRLDTVFKDEAQHLFLLRIRNLSNWHVVGEIKCGFENLINNSIRSDDGMITARGSFLIDQAHKLNGKNGLILNKNVSQTPVFQLNNIRQGDVIEMIIHQNRNQRHDYHNGKFCLVNSPGENVPDWIQVTEVPFFNMHEEWTQLRIKAVVNKQPGDSLLYGYFKYSGQVPVFLDDFIIRHYQQ